MDLAEFTKLPGTAEINPQEAERIAALGAFLRARRESIDPLRLGIPSIGRRRTPGLRRDDVAQLANISVTWYTRLEQGRPIHVSARVLDAIARALQCTESETQHLFTLAGLSRKADISKPSCRHASAAVQSILDHLDPLPAIIQTARFDIVGYNPAYCRLIGVDLATIAPEERNCLFQAIANPTWRARLADWENLIPQLAALYRAAMAEHMEDPIWQEQLQRFCTLSPEFHTMWQRQEVLGIENRTKRFHHPQLGIISLQQTNWWSAPKNGDRLLVYVPTDEKSKEAIRHME
ncbi:helix-turn-helix transcriptional regulator [Uliginosibacterium gangwonense]|uniref:helix-turn-helix transcriptional regulator n=1 Tax=Uliginosibacterium gangwonense TaxID=392736 RepID=UPI00037EEF6F|nr:helix-turn-helix transcriptional regulator [Uliginosibacterium gangwonense]